MNKTKVSERDKTSSPQQARCPYTSGELIRINFHPQTVEKMAPPCMARLDLVNCTFHVTDPIFLLELLALKMWKVGGNIKAMFSPDNAAISL